MEERTRKEIIILKLTAQTSGFFKGDKMTDREFKKFALVVMLIRIQADTEKLKKIKEPKEKKEFKIKLDTLIADYENLMKELKEEPLF